MTQCRERPDFSSWNLLIFNSIFLKNARQLIQPNFDIRNAVILSYAFRSGEKDHASPAARRDYETALGMEPDSWWIKEQLDKLN